MTNQRLLEIFFAQIIVYLLLWLYNSYFGFLMSIILGSIAIAILALSFVAEKIEPSKVPLWYFKLIALCAAAPLSVYVIYICVFGSSFAWMKN